MSAGVPQVLSSSAMGRVTRSISSGARRVPVGLEADTHIAASEQEGASRSQLPERMHDSPLASSSSPTANQQSAGVRTSPRLASSGLRNVGQFLDHPPKPHIPRGVISLHLLHHT